MSPRAAPIERPTLTGRERLCDACSVWKFCDAANYQPVTILPFRTEHRVQAFRRTCLACEKKAHAPGATRVCRACGMEKRADCFPTNRWVCMNCRRLRNHESGAQKAWRQRNRTRLRAYAAAYNRRAGRRCDLPIEEKRLRNRLQDALRRGKIAKPDRCSRCRRPVECKPRTAKLVKNPSPANPLFAYYPKGICASRLLEDVVWICAECRWAIKLGVEEGENYRDHLRSLSPAGRLNVAPEEWARIHEANVRKIEREQVVFDLAKQSLDVRRLFFLDCFYDLSEPQRVRAIELAMAREEHIC